ncbi:MAG: DUF1015 domain-containing protein [Kiritimatiellae bacterium]|nr:DUF1015 domain-containing protein [Kiritimatiellia bacterium]
MKINPFRAWRPAADLAGKVAAVPYDVVDTAEASALAAGNKYSFLHVSRPEIDLAPGTPCDSEEAYHQAKKALDAMRDEGILSQDASPCLYAYRQIMGDHAQTGIVACFETDDYKNGILKRHEKTRNDKEDDRTRHILTLKAHTGPVFLTYRDDAIIDVLVAKAMAGEPAFDFTADDGIRHTAWRIDETDALVDAFAKVPCAYIADGHHRAAAAARAAAAKGGEYRRFMAVIFPAKQLKLLPYNRLVADLNGLVAEEFLAKVANVFTVTPAPDGEVASPCHVRLYLNGAWHDLAWDKPTGTDPVARLDVSVLQDRLLAPVLGIENPRKSPRISFMGGIRGTQALADAVDKGEAAAAFSMFPVTIDQMMDIADAGAVMPPKSTWFEPKLRSGLFVHSC